MPISFHYFRLPRPQWELLLTRVRQLGAETIVTPVPWGFHQFAADRTDLTGLSVARRDLVGFVQLCAAMGFAVRLELSPVVPSAELLHNGLPGWLLHRHPEIRQVDADGKPRALPVWEHPVTEKLLRQWWQSLFDALQPLADKFSAQLMPLPAELDFSEHTTAVQWAIWLRKKYADGGVDALNAAYHPPTPFSTISAVKFNAPLDAPAFVQDKTDFTAYVATHAHETYRRWLTEIGWALADAIDLPPHAVHVAPDPADVGAGFRFAPDAPLRTDGSPTAEFWRQKESNTVTQLSTVPESYQILFTPPSETVKFEFADAVAPFRLLLSGEILPVETETADGKTTFPAVANDAHGQTDIHFTLPAADAPVGGTLAKYLRALVTAQQHALATAAQHITRLDALLKPDTATPDRPAAPELSEAHAALADANRALQRAAASIGALENVFATALDTAPAGNVSAEFLALEKEKLARVKTTCENALAAIGAADAPALPDTFTVTEYREAVQSAVQVSAAIVGQFENTLRWLREGLSDGTLAASAWSVHTRVETILSLLTNGVLRK